MARRACTTMRIWMISMRAWRQRRRASARLAFAFAVCLPVLTALRLPGLAPGRLRRSGRRLSGWDAAADRVN